MEISNEAIPNLKAGWLCDCGAWITQSNAYHTVTEYKAFTLDCNDFPYNIFKMTKKDLKSSWEKSTDILPQSIYDYLPTTSHSWDKENLPLYYKNHFLSDDIQSWFNQHIPIEQISGAGSSLTSPAPLPSKRSKK